jgi:hypothetical protein
MVKIFLRCGARRIAATTANGVGRDQCLLELGDGDLVDVKLEMERGPQLAPENSCLTRLNLPAFLLLGQIAELAK